MEIFLPRLEASTWDIIVEYMAVSLDLQIVFFLAVLEIFFTSLEASPWDTNVKYMAGSLDLQTVFFLEQLWRYFSPASRYLPRIQLLNIRLVLWISELCFFLRSFEDITTQLGGIYLG